MKIKRINGLVFEKMVRNALANLKNSESKINEMNVFPVTDGDTGTNMMLTLANGIEHAQSNEHLGNYLKRLSEGMLLGARGNSGVILSQIFKGFYDELESDSIADVSELRDAFVRAYKTAYASVARPVEGTILTVAREGIENIRSQIGRSTYVPNLFSMYLAELRKALERTPNILPVLREANVVDSGGYGYVLIIEGMEKSLYGEEIVAGEPISVQTGRVDSSLFNESSEFELGYCMEFLLQTLNSRKTLDIDDYIKSLSSMGSSLVVVQSQSVVKVHIHTKEPSPVISYSQGFGEFITFKLENMQIQHDELKKEEPSAPKEHKPLGIIAITNGSGVSELFESFNCDVIIDGGKTMNTSAEEILSAMQSISADKIILYPNHENIFKAAEQALSLSGLENVVIMPSKSVMQCYYSLAMDNGDSDLECRIASLVEGCNAVTTVSVTQCVKDCVCNDVVCVKGQYVVLLGSKPIACVKAYDDVVDVLCEKSLLIGKETCIIFTGVDIKDFDGDRMQSLIETAYPQIAVAYADGRQRIYDLIIGLV